MKIVKNIAKLFAVCLFALAMFACLLTRIDSVQKATESTQQSEIQLVEMQFSEESLPSNCIVEVLSSCKIPVNQHAQKQVTILQQNVYVAQKVHLWLKQQQCKIVRYFSGPDIIFPFQYFW